MTLIDVGCNLVKGVIVVCVPFPSLQWKSSINVFVYQYPGIFVALALRFDASRKKDSHYFRSAFAGYVAGLGTTIVVMNWFQAAQVCDYRGASIFLFHLSYGYFSDAFNLMTYSLPYYILFLE